MSTFIFLHEYMGAILADCSWPRPNTLLPILLKASLIKPSKRTVPRMGQIPSRPSDDQRTRLEESRAPIKQTQHSMEQDQGDIDQSQHSMEQDQDDIDQSQHRMEQDQDDMDESQRRIDQSQRRTENSINNGLKEMKTFRKDVKRSIKRLGLDAIDEKSEVERRKLECAIRRLGLQQKQERKDRVSKRQRQRQQRRQNRRALHNMTEALRSLTMGGDAEDEGGSERDMVGNEGSSQVGNMSVSGVGMDPRDCD